MSGGSYAEVKISSCRYHDCHYIEPPPNSTSLNVSTHELLNGSISPTRGGAKSGHPCDFWSKFLQAHPLRFRIAICYNRKETITGRKN